MLAQSRGFLWTPTAVHDPCRGQPLVNHIAAVCLCRHAAVANTGWCEIGGCGSARAQLSFVCCRTMLFSCAQEEIVDETDAFIDNEKTCKVNARVLAMSLPPGLRRLLVTSQQLQAQRLDHHHHQQLQLQQHSGTLPHPGSSPALVSAGSSGVLGSNPGGVGKPARGSMSILGAAGAAAGGSKPSH